MALFIKLRVKLLYSIANHPQTDGSSEQTNQTVKIALCFFVYALEDLIYWLEVLSYIQSILNNTLSFTTGKTSNKITYGFSPRKPLDLVSPSSLPNIYVARADIANTISFTLAN